MLKERRVGRRPTFLPSVVLGDGLAEVDVYASIVDEDVVHLEVGVFAVAGLLELHKGVLERIPRLPVLYHLAALDRTEPQTPTPNQYTPMGPPRRDRHSFKCRVELEKK